MLGLPERWRKVRDLEELICERKERMISGRSQLVNLNIDSFGRPATTFSQLLATLKFIEIRSMTSIETRRESQSSFPTIFKSLRLR